MGADDEYIDAKREALRERAETTITEFVIWPDLLPAWSVFSRCRWQVIAGMGGAFWSGIEAVEIRSVASMVGVDMTAELLDDVRLMEREAGPILNARNQ